MDSLAGASMASRPCFLNLQRGACFQNRECSRRSSARHFGSNNTMAVAKFSGALVHCQRKPLLRTSLADGKHSSVVRCTNLTQEVAVAERASIVEAPVLPFRIGHGFDLHRLEPGLKLIIGGVDIPHDRGCDAHSDGDVLMHCIVDAILGALSLPDIGQLFPDNDAKWKGMPSNVFMREAVRRMEEAGYTIGNLDATVILQRPKLSPHKPAIVANLCELLKVPPTVVNIKAKTHEKVDSLGENRSVACHTVVLLMRK